jgi:4-amino-4-deoxy-L-arabinose transferase-like glycosyltransferase
VRPSSRPALDPPSGRGSRNPTAVHGGVETATPPPITTPAPESRPARPALLRRWAGVVSDSRWVTAGAVVAIVAGLVLRFLTLSPLWLDEAQSVAIARLPLPQLFDALRQDGSPPLYYLLLHWWIGVFGQSDLAVRSLSGVFGVLALPLAWRVARQVAGVRTAQAVLLLLATSPFAVRYSSETRMYSLMVLLTVLGAMAVRLAVRRRGPWPVLAVAAVTAGLMLTHYWGFYLLAVVGILALVALRTHREPALRVIGGMVLGVVAFLPWIPSFLVQVAHTGTPWAGRGGIQVFPVALTAWRGGNDTAAWALGVVLLLLLVVGLLAVPGGRSWRGPALLLELRVRPSRAVLFALFAGTLVVAAIVCAITDSATVARYTSVALLPFLALAALGVVALPTAAARRVTLAVACVLGLVTVLPTAWTPRTQAGEVATALEQAAPGAQVVFCPDQLGPAVARLAKPGLRLVSFPDLRPAGRVDWTDYAERNESRTGAAVAKEVLARSHGGEIWVDVSDGYRVPSTERCQSLVDAIASFRGDGEEMVERGGEYEGEQLLRFAPGPTG